MTFKKGDKKPTTSGKKKGTLNKATVLMVSVRDTVLNAFNEMQADPKANILAWGKENPKDFYNIAAKLIPNEISNKVVIIGKDLEDEQYVD